MTTLPIHITSHHLSMSPPLRDFVRMKFAKVRRFASDAVAADIVLRRDHGTVSGKRFSASARLAVPGRALHGSATHADLHTAVVKLVATLARRSRKRKRDSRGLTGRAALTVPSNSEPLYDVGSDLRHSESAILFV